MGPCKSYANLHSHNDKLGNYFSYINNILGHSKTTVQEPYNLPWKVAKNNLLRYILSTAGGGGGKPTRSVNVFTNVFLSVC